MTVAQNAWPLPPMPYLDALSVALERARSANRESLPAAGKIVEKTVAGGGIVYVFGSGHSQLAALELNQRAGSIAALQVIFDPTWGAAEHLAGYGETLLRHEAPGPEDCLIVISHSGVTAAAIDIARRARTVGSPVVAVMSLRAFTKCSGRLSPGSGLVDLADVVLDNGTGESDPGIGVEGLTAFVGPTSTVVSAALMHQLVVDAVQRLAVRGLEAPVLRPNLEDGAKEHNDRLRDIYKGRTRRVP